MAATAVTPQAGITSVISTGGTAETVVPSSPNGGYIVNPYTNTDQNISIAEWLYVDPVTSAIIGAYGTAVGLAPGGFYNIIPGQTTTLSVNAATTGHRFTVVYY